MEKKLFLLSLIISLTLQAFIPIYDIENNISLLNITIEEDNYYETVLNSTIEVMKNYAYINILKSPPKVNGYDYFQKVDIIQDLENLKEKVNKETTFYQFYQEISKIIDSAKDYHIYFGYFGKIEPFNLLTKIYVCSPIEFDFQRNKSVLGKINNYIYSLGKGSVQIENQEKINDNYNNKIAIEKINGINVYEFLRNFCGDYIQFKSPAAKFVWNRENIKIAQLWQCPLNPEEFSSFDITYSNGETITSKYIGFLDNETNNNEINSLFNKNEVNPAYNNEFLKYNDEKNSIDWDINIDNHIKCKVDNTNHVNVIYQNSFRPNNADPIGIINNFSYCHGNFSNNDYPLIVIENLNGGGFAQLAKLMQQLVQDLMKPKNYFSVIHNENTKEFLESNKDSFIFVDDEEKRNLTINEFYDDNIIEQFGEVIIERSKQRLLLDLNFESLIKENIFKRNKIKKPTDIIVFTDGLSFSSTSVFIKNLYYFGGAILVGYGGDPELDTFDASQSPTFVLTNLTGFDGYSDLLKKGFVFAQLPSGPMYRTKYDKNNNDVPEEFTVNYIDERINIYNAYDDSLYQDFIDEAKKIFDKYKTKCNPNNSYIKLLSNECKFDNYYTHGGYVCGNDGIWSQTCEPFYCDEDYYFDYNSRKCIWSNGKTINVDSIQTFSINYQDEILFKFNTDNIANTNDVKVNIHSMNCKIKVTFENANLNDNILINQMNDDIFSFMVNNKDIEYSKFKITPIKYMIDGEIKENYENKTCSIIITNLQTNKNNVPSLKLIDSSNLYFDENLKEIQLYYDINDEALDSPIALSLSFNQNSLFDISINIPENENVVINKQIWNSTFIFFDSEFNKGDQLAINVKHINYTTPIFMNIKMIKNIEISMLEQNNLNLGFISSQVEYQYYYMEVFKYEEGEIMLHNKRENGILIAYLIEKSKISDLNDITIYPKNEINPSLKFNEHTLKLSFNYKDTLICENGCYLLITYYKKNYDEDNLILKGYEYTILSRIWDYMEFSPQIINIPFNEYILGSFEKNSITHHYYSIFIPAEAKKIIIQLEGNYLDGFIGEGIIKLNTMKEIDKIKNLDIINNQNVFELRMDNMPFDFRNKYISLAFRSKNFFEDIFSFYYFRIFYFKQKETIYYPVDSNFGNLCSPTYENEKYYCNFILNNKYNELSSNFSITGTNLIEYFRIHYFHINNANIEVNGNIVDFKYIYSNDTNYGDINYIYFRFEFSEKGIKNVISAFYDRCTDNFPQIYSARLYYLFDITKNFNYNLKHNYILNYKYIGGYVGMINLNIFKSDFKNRMFLTRNFRGKPIGIQVSDKAKNMSFTGFSSFYYIFYMKLNYKIKANRIEEVISGETKSAIMTEGHFPLYYYLDLKKKTNINVDINIRLNSYDDSLLRNDFEIKGYIVGEDIIQRKIKGEYIDFKGYENILGTFIESYNFGLLQINKNYINENDFILISITNKDKEYFNSSLLVEIVNNEYPEKYFMPINQYIFESFDINKTNARNVNNYIIDINDKYDSNTTIFVEFSPNYQDLKLTFDDKDNIDFLYFTTGGFQKYRIKENDNGMVYFNVSNPNKRNDANYILRYYYTEETMENKYEFDNSFSLEEIDSSDDDNFVSISLKFNNIKVTRNNVELTDENYTITFFVNGFLYKKEENKEKLLNTSAVIKNREYLYKAKTSSIYRYDKNIILIFKNISRDDNYIYDLQFRVNVYIDDDNIFNEEFLTYNIEVDLTDIKSSKVYIWVIISAGILIFIILIFIGFYYCRKIILRNEQLREEVLSNKYSAGIEKNVLLKEEQSKKDDDYEKTFI